MLKTKKDAHPENGYLLERDDETYFSRQTYGRLGSFFNEHSKTKPTQEYIGTTLLSSFVSTSA